MVLDSCLDYIAEKFSQRLDRVTVTNIGRGHPALDSYVIRINKNYIGGYKAYFKRKSNQRSESTLV